MCIAICREFRLATTPGSVDGMSGMRDTFQAGLSMVHRSAESKEFRRESRENPFEDGPCRPRVAVELVCTVRGFSIVRLLVPYLLSCMTV